MGAGFGDSLAAGLGALAGGEDFEGVAKGVVESSLLNLIPLFGIGQLAATLVGVLKSIWGKEPKPPILGYLLDPDSIDPNGVVHLVAKASMQRAMGLDRFTDVTSRGVVVNMPRVLGGAWIDSNVWSLWWVQDLHVELADAYLTGGAEKVVLQLKSSATNLQAFHAAVALWDWRQATAGVKAAKLYANLESVEASVLRGNLPADPVGKYWFGGERSLLKGKHSLFKRLGLPSWSEYKAAVDANKGPSAGPTIEPFPGATAGSLAPLVELTAAPLELATKATGSKGGLISSATTAGKASGLEDSPKVKPKPKPRPAEVPVAVGLGALALLLLI